MTADLTALALTGPFAHEAVGPSDLWSDWHVDPLLAAGLALLAVAYRQGLASCRRPSRASGVSRNARRVIGESGSSLARSDGQGPAELIRGGGTPRAAKLAGDNRRGVARHPTSRPLVGGREVGAFVVGLLVLVVALVSPLEGMAGALFSAHMVQHLLLVVVAAPLLVVGRTGRMVEMALPRSARRRLRRTLSRRRLRRVADVVWHPLVVWGLGTAVLWVWHLPSPYEAALAHDLLHGVEHLTLVATALLGWAVVLGRGRHTAAVPVAVLLLFGTALQGAALGAVLVFARTPLYPIHEPTAPLWDLTPLEDQQLAGGLMWVPPGLVYLGVTAALVVRWFNSLDTPELGSETVVKQPFSCQVQEGAEAPTQLGSETVIRQPFPCQVRSGEGAT